MSAPICWCGQPGVERHHPTARIAGEHSAYLDPEFWAWACHDDHALAYDDQVRMAEFEPELGGPNSTRLEVLEVRLRRVAAFFGRLAEAIGLPALVPILAIFATHADRWANELHDVIGILDAGIPGWRTLPGLHG